MPFIGIGEPGEEDVWGGWVIKELYFWGVVIKSSWEQLDT